MPGHVARIPIQPKPTSEPPHAKQGDAPLREALLRMRADEACIHHLNIVLADLRPGDRQADSLALDSMALAAHDLASIEALPACAWKLTRHTVPEPCTKCSWTSTARAS